MLDEQRIPTLPHNALTGNYVVYFSLGYTVDCMNNITKTMNENISSFLDGLYTETRMQLPAWVLWVL